MSANQGSAFPAPKMSRKHEFQAVPAEEISSDSDTYLDLEEELEEEYERTYRRNQIGISSIIFLCCVLFLIFLCQSGNSMEGESLILLAKVAPSVETKTKQEHNNEIMGNLRMMERVHVKSGKFDYGKSENVDGKSENVGGKSNNVDVEFKDKYRTSGKFPINEELDKMMKDFDLLLNGENSIKNPEYLKDSFGNLGDVDYKDGYPAFPKFSKMNGEFDKLMNDLLLNGKIPECLKQAFGDVDYKDSYPTSMKFTMTNEDLDKIMNNFLKKKSSGKIPEHLKESFGNLNESPGTLLDFDWNLNREELKPGFRILRKEPSKLQELKKLEKEDVEKMNVKREIAEWKSEKVWFGKGKMKGDLKNRKKKPDESGKNSLNYVKFVKKYPKSGIKSVNA